MLPVDELLNKIVREGYRPKQKICNKKGITKIDVPYTEIKPDKRLYSFIKKELKNNNIEIRIGRKEG